MQEKPAMKAKPFTLGMAGTVMRIPCEEKIC